MGTKPHKLPASNLPIGNLVGVSPICFGDGWLSVFVMGWGLLGCDVGSETVTFIFCDWLDIGCMFR